MSNPTKDVAEVLIKAMLPPEEVTAEPETDEAIETPELQDSQLEIEEPSNSETLEQPVETQEEIDTLNNLAEELDIPIEDMYALNLKMPDSDPATLGELKNFYLDNKDLVQARADIENERSGLKAEAEKLQQTPPIHPEHIQAQAQLMMVQNEWNSTNWEQLRVDNPAEFAARQTDLKNRYEQANYAVQNVNQVIEAREQQARVTEQQALFKAVPELEDESVRVKATERLTKYISKYGFTAKDLEHITNSKLMHLLLDASKLAEMKVDARSKQIDTAPRVLKPQSVQNSQAGRKASLKRLTEKARGGTSRDKTSAINALLQTR